MEDKQIFTPRKLTAANINLFLEMAKIIFSSQGKRVPGVKFNTSSTEQADLIGLLLLYKFYEFTVHKLCFYNPTSVIKKYLNDELIQYGLKDLVDCFIKYKDPQYNKLRFKIENKLFISPILLDKNSKNDEVSVAGKDICSFYERQNDIQYIVLTCMGELAQNFKAHAQSDTTSILSVTGNEHFFEVGCVDTGDGIISTLDNSFKDKHIIIPREKILLKSLERGITSKNVSSGHMGYGLWLLKELILVSKGELHLYSEGYYVKIHNGKIKTGKAAFWQGSIVDIRIPLHKPKIIMQKMLELRPKNINIKIRMQ